jgi:uncharacterized membrane protein YkoI
MKTLTKLIVAAPLLVTLGLAGVAHLVQAAQIRASIAVMPEHHRESQKTQASGGDGEPQDDGLGQFNSGRKETNANAKEQTSDQSEAAKLEPLAKITARQAQKLAEVAQGSKSSRVKLENEDGNLVYAVAIGQKEVMVDAGNGRVLYTEALNRSENKKTETSHPRSSIQVSEAPGGDGDGETNDDG